LLISAYQNVEILDFKWLFQ